MRSEQFRAVFRSLRFRLTAWNTTVVLLTVLLALFGVHEGLRLSLVNEMDKSLLANTHEISSAIEQSYPDLEGPIKEMTHMVLGHEEGGEGGLFVQLLAPRWQNPLVERQSAAARRRAVAGAQPSVAAWHPRLSDGADGASRSQACRRSRCGSAPR